MSSYVKVLIGGALAGVAGTLFDHRQFGLALVIGWVAVRWLNRGADEL